MSILTSALKVLVGRENVAFGTTAAVMVPLTVEVPQLPMGEGGREMLADNGSSQYQHDNRAMIRGLERRQPVKASMLARHSPTQLIAAATPPVAPSAGAGALSQDIVLEHWLGGFHAGAGSATTGTPTVNSIPVTTGHGARFAVGCMVIVYVAGVPTAPRQVTAIATDTLTVFPDLAVAPASGQVVLNSTCFYRVENHTQTMTVEAAHYEPGTPEAQQRGRGVRGQCAWTAEVGGTAMLAFDGMLQARDDGNLSISVSGSAEDMGDPVVWHGDSYLWTLGETDPPPHLCVSKLAVAVPNTWQEVVCTGGVEGASGVVMTGGRSAPATVEITTEFDADLADLFSAGGEASLLVYATRGTGTAQRWTGWHFPRLAFDAEPTRADDGGLVKSVLKFRALGNTTAAGDPLGASSTNLARSPVVFFRF
jgi:hypothetical protein